MKRYFIIIPILVLLSCTVFAAQKRGLSDSEISGLLTGKWRVMLSEDNTKLDAVNEYRSDGTMVQEGRLTVSGKRMNIHIESTWKVEKGKLISTLVSIRPRGILQAGLTTTDTVISIDKTEYVFRDDKTGKRQTYYRIK